MSTIGAGVVPARPVDPGVVKGLFAERVAQNALWQEATTIAPIIEMAATSGTMPVDGTYRGVDLSEDDTIETAKALTGTVYQDISITFDTEAFALGRYVLGKAEHSFLNAARLQLDNGIDFEAHLADVFASRAAGLHYKQVITALTTTGNYASGYAADPGNITSASFDLIGLLQTAGDALIKSQSWDGSSELVVVVANDVWPYLQKLNQVLNRAGTANSTYPTPDMVAEWFRAYMGAPVRVVRDRGFYNAANGTKTATGSGYIAFMIPRNGSFGRGHVATLTGAGLPGGILDLRTQEAQDLAGGGQRFYADAYYDVHVEDINGSGSTSGYLAHTLLS